MIIETGLYLLLGAFAGILAGLLGVGGGLIIVPILAAIFVSQNISNDIIMHLAIGTSLASILFTSLSSIYSHHKKQAVDWNNVFKLTPGILLGAFLGGILASLINSDNLKPIFAGFELLIALYMLSNIKPKQHYKPASFINFSISGSMIGYISAIMGIGGGTMTVPWQMWHGSSIHKAIATSAAVGFPIALGGAISYLVMGWNHPSLPNHATGFIYLPALMGIILSSVLFAALGAKWAHQLDVAKLKQLFAYLLIGLAGYLFST